MRLARSATCRTPASPGRFPSSMPRRSPAASADPQPVHLDEVGRGIAQATFDAMALSIAAFEASPEVSSFSSKYDAVMGKNDKFTAQEQLGYDLFRGKARCNECHRDG